MQELGFAAEKTTLTFYKQMSGRSEWVIDLPTIDEEISSLKSGTTDAKKLKSAKILSQKWWLFDLFSVTFHLLSAVIISCPLLVIYTYFQISQAPYEIADYIQAIQLADLT